MLMVEQGIVEVAIPAPALMELMPGMLPLPLPTAVLTPPALVRRVKAMGHSPKCLLANGK